MLRKTMELALNTMTYERHNCRFFKYLVVLGYLVLPGLSPVNNKLFDNIYFYNLLHFVNFTTIMQCDYDF